MATLLGAEDATYRPSFSVAKRSSPACAGDVIAPSTVQGRQPPCHSPKPDPFEDRLKKALEGQEHDATVFPIVVKASQKEVDAYLEKHEETIHFRWHCYGGNFYIDELNHSVHERSTAEAIGQLGNAMSQHEGFVCSGSESCAGPEESYGKIIKPDGCIFNTKYEVDDADADAAANSTRKSYYPSVVVEVAYSQNEDSLKNKVNAWFASGNYNTGVRCVVEILFDYQDPPASMKYRLVRRHKQRRPGYSTIQLEDFRRELESNRETAKQNPKYILDIPAEDVFYPDEPPPDVKSVPLNCGGIYASVGIFSQAGAAQGKPKAKRQAAQGKPKAKRRKRK